MNSNSLLFHFVSIIYNEEFFTVTTIQYYKQGIFHQNVLNLFGLSDNSGGGSGGRIAIYQRESKRFRGIVSALGGSCSSNYYGGPGSVVNVVTLGTDIENFLEIDNLGRNSASYCSQPVVLTVNEKFWFEEIYLKRRGCFSLSVVCIFGSVPSFHTLILKVFSLKVFNL